MLNEFKIAETENFREKIKKPENRKLYDKIYNYIYPQIRKNPFFGKNIKKLKGEFEQVYRYRIGNIRLFYSFEKEKVIIVMIDIEKRKDA